MRIKVVLLASYRDLAGTSELVLEVPPGSCAADAVAVLRERSTSTARIPARPVVAVNHEYASLDAELREGDEMALLPPVAGG
jgi:molybdopterin converting factor small subunit